MSDSSAVAEAEQAVADATSGDAGSEGPKFTLELNQDQQDIRDWVHGFAEGVVRPAAAEWDEREETPWPVIQEAAKIGLYSFEALGQFFGDDTGLTLPNAEDEI
jgi:acyl-CoA dehydrogenase